MGRLESVGTAAGVSTTTSLESTVGFIINIVLSLIGVIMVVLIIYAGFLWMTAAGEPKKVEKAKDILQAAIIGLVIVLAAYAIASFVVSKLITATTT